MRRESSSGGLSALSHSWIQVRSGFPSITKSRNTPVVVRLRQNESRRGIGSSRTRCPTRVKNGARAAFPIRGSVCRGRPMDRSIPVRRTPGGPRRLQPTLARTHSVVPAPVPVPPATLAAQSIPAWPAVGSSTTLDSYLSAEGIRGGYSIGLQSWVSHRNRG